MQDGASDCEQAIVGEVHEAAAMNVAGSIEVLLLDPERAANAAVVLHPVPERPDMGLETVAAPGPPARKFAVGTDMQVRAVQKCRFGQVIHAIWPSIESFCS